MKRDAGLPLEQEGGMYSAVSVDMASYDRCAQCHAKFAAQLQRFTL